MDPRAGLYRRSSSRSRRGSGSRETRLKRKLLVTRLFAIVTLGVIVALSLVLISIKSEGDNYNAENAALASELNRTQGELKQAKQLVTAQEVELSSLIKQRIPGVTKLQIDKLYDVNKQYLKKLSFTEAGVGAERQIAYYAILQNTSSAPVKPDALILLFDRKGLQVGAARITKDAATTPVKSEDLAPGEKRTYTAPMPRSRADAPHYFLVELR